jgi:UDP-hydrolysing UDP-N-acetyl-D-glucosamine 2-epimerase
MSARKSKICVPITNRTNYSKLKPVLLELRKRSDLASIHIVASSSILLEKYGEAFHDLEKDGFEIEKKIDCVLMNDTHEAMAKTVGLSMIEHASYFSWLKPDLMLVVGDRYDMMAPALASSLMNIPIGHIQGGETSGTIDNTVRATISRMARLHFVATEKSRQNLEKFGVDPAHIHNFGCPAVEYVSTLDVGDRFDPSRMKKKFKRELKIKPDQKYFLVMAHPDTTHENDVDMDAILRAIETFDLPAFVFYPNVDAQNFRIVSGIVNHRDNPNLYLTRHMPIEDFVRAMAHSAVMIGNSSAGIREAASFGVPVLNIGSRQQGRERNPNVIDIESDFETIRNTIGKYLDHRFDRTNLYYTPGCSRKMVDTLFSHLESQA